MEKPTFRPRRLGHPRHLGLALLLGGILAGAALPLGPAGAAPAPMAFGSATVCAPLHLAGGKAVPARGPVAQSPRPAPRQPPAAGKSARTGREMAVAPRRRMPARPVQPEEPPATVMPAVFSCPAALAAARAMAPPRRS